MPTEVTGTLSTFGNQVLSNKYSEPKTKFGTSGRITNLGGVLEKQWEPLNLCTVSLPVPYGAAIKLKKAWLFHVRALQHQGLLLELYGASQPAVTGLQIKKEYICPLQPWTCRCQTLLGFAEWPTLSRDPSCK